MTGELLSVAAAIGAAGWDRRRVGRNTLRAAPSGSVAVARQPWHGKAERSALAGACPTGFCGLSGFPVACTTLSNGVPFRRG